MLKKEQSFPVETESLDERIAAAPRENLANPNPDDPHVASLTFPDLSPAVSNLATEFLQELPKIFIPEKTTDQLDKDLQTLRRELQSLGVEIDSNNDDQFWAATTTNQLIPHSDFRTGVSLELKKSIYEYLLSIFGQETGEKTITINVLDFPPASQYHRDGVSQRDVFQSEGVGFLEYAALRNLFSLLTPVLETLKNADVKIKLNLQLEDFSLALDQDQVATATIQLQAIQEQICATLPELAVNLEINWQRESSFFDEAKEQALNQLSQQIKDFYFRSELIFQNALQEADIENWSELKKSLAAPGVKKDAQDFDALEQYRNAVSGMTKDLFNEAGRFVNLPGKDTFLAMFTPSEKERLLRQMATVSGREDESYQQLFFDEQLVAALCHYLASKIILSKELETGINFNFGEQLAEAKDPRQVVTLRSLGKAMKAKTQPLFAQQADIGSQKFKDKKEALLIGVKDLSGTSPVKAELVLRGENRVKIPLIMRFSPEDLDPNATRGHLLDLEELAAQIGVNSVK